jgi:bifunctional DNA-binding transcriptional regulator/antitoxin component of YhaV-PrlF toxin-antitoxin module
MLQYTVRCDIHDDAGRSIQPVARTVFSSLAHLEEAAAEAPLEVRKRGEAAGGGRRDTLCAPTLLAMPTQRRKSRSSGARKPQSPVTEATRVGNLGCIRFPLPIREASGIKRGDRLRAAVAPDRSIVLSKLPVDPAEQPLSVAECTCRNQPEGCREAKEILGVGWSYVQFGAAEAEALGLLPGTPLLLVGEPMRITLFVNPALSPAQQQAVGSVRCPP